MVRTEKQSCRKTRLFFIIGNTLSKIAVVWSNAIKNCFSNSCKAKRRLCFLFLYRRLLLCGVMLSRIALAILVKQSAGFAFVEWF